MMPLTTRKLLIPCSARITKAINPPNRGTRQVHKQTTELAQSQGADPVIERFTSAAIAEVDRETARTALEKRDLTPARKVKTGKSVRYGFSKDDVLFLLVLTEFPFPLSKQDKLSLAKVLVHGEKAAKQWASEGADLVFHAGEMKIFVEFKSFRETVERNVAAYHWGKERIVSSPDILSGEPVFRGTRIPLDHVASLFRKEVPEEEIAEDFPSLTARDLEYARLAARFGAPPGRPKKRLRIERLDGK